MPPGEPVESHTLWVLQGGDIRPVSVKLGLSDGTATEVVEGDLKEGDEVVVDTLGADSSAPASGGAGGGALRRLF
jgi:HlyD family secretion protein